MRKTLLTLPVALLLGTSIHAQITLSASSYSTANIAGTSDGILMSGSGSTYPTLTASSNGSWDMTTATSTSVMGSLSHVAASPGFNAQFANSVSFQFSAYSYPGNVELGLTANSYQEVGEHISRSVIDLPLGASDSIVIDSQEIIYNTPRTILSFPATAGSTWSSTYKYDFGFHLTVPQFALVNTASMITAYVTETDTVIGYGQMRVNDANGNPSGYMAVLQVKTTTSTTDSFFVGGQVAPTALLSAFQVTQGQTIVSNEQNYYRAGEFVPLANVTFSDGNGMNPTSAQTDDERLAPSAVTTISNSGNIRIYPNPATNYQFNVDVQNAGNGTWSYDLINMAGQIVASAPIQLNNGQQARVNLAAELPTGMYFVRLNNNGVQALVRPIAITQ